MNLPFRDFFASHHCYPPPCVREHQKANLPSSNGPKLQKQHQHHHLYQLHHRKPYLVHQHHHHSTNTIITKREKTVETTKIKKTKTVNRRSTQRYLKCIYNNTLSHNIYSCSNTNCIICAKSLVANPSGKDLSDPQILLLSKGLGFIPTARDSELLHDFDSFSKKSGRSHIQVTEEN